MASTMKEAIVSKGPKVHIRDVPVPSPGPKQVVIKVSHSGSNPKDWKIPEWMPDQPASNQGDDIAGVVESVGDEVFEFKKGDRVAAFHEMMTPGGSYAEYAVAYDHATFFLPKNTSFQAGAAIPLAAMTAAIGLYAQDRLSLPTPLSPATATIPLVIYGASSAVGTYALQFAKRSNIHPIICIAGRAQNHVEAFLDRSKGDTIVDYRQGDEAVAQGIKNALPAGHKLEYAFDAVSEKNSYQNICQVLDAHGRITLVLPGQEYPEIPKTVHQSMTNVGDAHSKQKDLAFVFFRLISRGLEEGWFTAQPQEVIPGGLGGIESALTKLKDGTASAVKYVFDISETRA